jgi:hypothetical protein
VNEVEILRELLTLADETGLRVRPIRGIAASESEPAASSGTVRVRDETWVVLSGTDSVGERVAVLARALRQHAGAELDRRYLPPALRELLTPTD